MIHPDVFKDFRIKVNKCYKVRGAYICETDEGTKAIRRSDYTPAQITLQHNIKEHLIKRGFNCVDRLYVSKNNTPYTIYYNRIFVMSDWYNGPEMDFYNPENLEQIMGLLAQMHIAGEDFKVPGYNVGEAKIKNLGDTYHKRYTEAIKLQKRIMNQGNKTDFEVLYLKNVSEYINLQEMALELVNADSYETLIESARRRQTVSHQKYTYHNLKMVSSDRVIVSGFEKSNYDVQLTDVAYVTRRIMQRNQWDLDLLMDTINLYNKVKPLSSKEWDVLRGMIIFPDRFSKLCNQYYYSKRRWNYNMYYRKFSNMLDYKDVQVSCAKEILKW